MKLKTVGVFYGEVRSVNFQSCRVEVYLEAELDSPSEEPEALIILEQRCLEAVNKAFERHEGRKVTKLLEKADARTKG